MSSSGTWIVWLDRVYDECLQGLQCTTPIQGRKGVRCQSPVPPNFDMKANAFIQAWFVASILIWRIRGASRFSRKALHTGKLTELTVALPAVFQNRSTAQ